MSKDLIPFPPPEQPRWGVIIVTGITAFLTVVLGGYLVQQVSREVNNRFHPATALPAYQPAQAVPISHQGHWSVKVRVILPSGEVLTQQRAGVGKVGSPQVKQLPPGSTYNWDYSFYLTFSVPSLTSTGVTLPAQPQMLPFDLNLYLQALQQTYYALYNAADEFLYVRDARQLAELGISLPQQPR